MYGLIVAKLEVAPPTTLKSASLNPVTFLEKATRTLKIVFCTPVGGVMVTLGTSVSALITACVAVMLPLPALSCATLAAKSMVMFAAELAVGVTSKV